ncbi:MAG: hypothetical protein PHD42_06620, partial [Dysgonamonadaceae bacterium]|nr:hypothetical protein [Dysgonamonadaceae bacterium]
MNKTAEKPVVAIKRAVFVLVFLYLTLSAIHAEEIDTTGISNTFQLGEVVVLAPRSDNTVGQDFNLQMNNTNVSEALRSIPSV